jgi:hypothetical protein
VIMLLRVGTRPGVDLGQSARRGVGVRSAMTLVITVVAVIQPAVSMRGCSRASGEYVWLW